MFLASVIANAVPVQDDLVIALEDDDVAGAHDRETRSEKLGIPWYLDRIDQRKSRRLNGKYNTFANGAGVDIYILADGIEYDNEEFGGRAFDVEFMPPHSHGQGRCTKYGTHIASLAAGIYAGVAKSSNIYVARITINLLTCHLFTSYENVVMAVEYVIKRVKMTGRRSVLAIPLVTDRSPNLSTTVEEAVKENIIVVTPAGNSLRDACRYSPGSSSHVINVGVTKMEKGKDKLYRSNYGPCVSLYAPGKYKTGSGTAQACAIVTGAAALVLEKYPHYTPAEVKQYLIDKATNDVINMDAIRLKPGDKGTNKLLYVGNRDTDESSGDHFDDTIGNEDDN